MERTLTPLNNYADMKEEYIALVKMVVDTITGAEYLFQD